jgi:release factor glutamine methyltransferase
VFKPGLLRSGRLLARVLRSLPAEELEGRRVLDLGCGSGVGSVHAALRGARVTAVDLNPAAVRSAEINARVSMVEPSVDARAGDLFDAVAGERFDVILFNPPFFEGEPTSALDLAFHGQGVFERFVAGLPDHLAPDGALHLVLSTDGDGQRLVDMLAATCDVAVERTERYAHETLVAYRVERRAEAGAPPAAVADPEPVEALR